MKNDSFFQNLQQNGLRLTPVLRAVFELLAQTPNPLSAPQLTDALKKKHHLEPNKSTLYRQLEKLVELGILQSVSTDSQLQRFELKKEHHHHFVCQNCEKVMDIETGPLEKVMHQFEKKLKTLGHHIKKHELTFFGLCQSCIT